MKRGESDILLIGLALLVFILALVIFIPRPGNKQNEVKIDIPEQKPVLPTLSESATLIASNTCQTKCDAIKDPESVEDFCASFVSTEELGARIIGEVAACGEKIPCVALVKCKEYSPDSCKTLLFSSTKGIEKYTKLIQDVGSESFTVAGGCELPGAGASTQSASWKAQFGYTITAIPNGS